MQNHAILAKKTCHLTKIMVSVISVISVGVKSSFAFGCRIWQ